MRSLRFVQQAMPRESSPCFNCFFGQHAISFEYQLHGFGKVLARFVESRPLRVRSGKLLYKAMWPSGTFSKPAVKFIQPSLLLKFQHPFGVEMINLPPFIFRDVDLVEHFDDVANEQRSALRIEGTIGAEQHVVAAKEIDAAAGS